MNIQKDKIQHFAVCLMVTLFASALVWLITGSLMWGCSTGTALAAGLALGKEYGDKNAAGNHWCWWDLLADFCGILVAVLLLVLSNVVLEWLLK
nr:MAG TPA: putative periplasmic lipoprotein [Caudoviricetes sp.]